MTPDERELRQALDARSGEASAAFHARLSAVLADGRPSTDLRPALAVAVAMLLSVATVGVVLLSRHGGGSTPVGGGVIASPSPPPPTVASGPRVSVPPPTLPPGAIVLPTNLQLSAPDSDVVWAFFPGYNRLFRSTDRGATWQQRPALPARIAEVSFVSDREGWAMDNALSLEQCQGQGPATLRHTVDGGSTWQTVAGSGIPPVGCKANLSFVDPLHGFLDVWDDQSAPVIYRTADGGRTWTASRLLPDPPGFTTRGAGVTLHASRVHAFGSTLLVEADDTLGVAYVFRSMDAGATWTYLARIPQPPNSMAFLTATHWLQIDMGQSLETLDAGATWHTVTSTYTQAAGVAPEVLFGSPQVGYATVRGSIQRTSDGGAHWTAVQTPGT